MKKEEDAVSIEDLSETHQEYARVIGVEALLKLSEYFGGTQIYIPKKEELIKNKIYRLVKKEYRDGQLGIKALARKYGISETTVYRLVKGHIKTLPGQINIFDFIPHE